MGGHLCTTCVPKFGLIFGPFDKFHLLPQENVSDVGEWGGHLGLARAPTTPPLLWRGGGGVHSAVAAALCCMRCCAIVFCQRQCRSSQSEAYCSSSSP